MELLFIAGVLLIWWAVRAVKRHPHPEPREGIFYVYVWLNDDNRALYVGQTTRNPMVRGLEHWNEQPWIDQARALQWWVVYTKWDMNQLERDMIARLNPVYNKVRYGA